MAADVYFNRDIKARIEALVFMARRYNGPYRAGFVDALIAVGKSFDIEIGVLPSTDDDVRTITINQE